MVGKDAAPNHTPSRLFRKARLNRTFRVVLRASSRTKAIRSLRKLPDRMLTLCTPGEVPARGLDESPGYQYGTPMEMRVVASWFSATFATRITSHHLYRGRFMVIAAGLSLLWSATASGQLTWGTGGNGGNGTWNTTTANWWNGSSNVTWTNGGSAIFSGTGGTVTSTFPGPGATSLTFDSAGYTIQSGWVSASGGNLTITTNQPATISSTLNDAVASAGILVKTGAATLTVSGTNFFDNVLVNAGEFRVAGTSTLFFSNVILADTPSAVVTLGQTSSGAEIRSLSGGGPAGGILQPDTQTRTVTATIMDTGTFRGVAQDNGNGILALKVLTPSKTITLTGINTYSGGTAIDSGTLALSENGSALGSAVTISNGGTLRLDNTLTVVANRLPDATDVTMQGGRIELVGNSSTPVEELLGTLKFTGAVFINNTQSGNATSKLTFAGAARQNHATIDFTGNGRTKWTGISNDASGIVGAYATVGNEWATVGGDGSVDALATYATDINAASPGSNVKISGGGTTTLTASAVRSTLNFQNNSGSNGTLDLGGSNTLTLDGGGILASGTGTNQIQNGTLHAGGSELVVTNRNALTIDANIGETVAGTVLTKSGSGLLTLSGSNTYSGNTIINQGTLVVSSDASLGTGNTIQFNGGTLKAASSFSSAKSLDKGANYSGVIDTGGFNVEFSGTNSSVRKIGAGVLTLTNPSVGSVAVAEGTLVLTNPTSGSATLQGGTLRASGTLSSLTVSSNSTLDIGGSGAGSLTTATLSLQGSLSQVLTIRFGLGLSVLDVWTITNPVSAFNIAPGTFLFDFQDLGGVTTGTNYTLMSLPTIGAPLNAGMFGFAPSAAAAGWNGTFSINANTVRVNLSAIPEPRVSILLLIGTLLLVLSRCGFKSRV